MVVTGEEEEQKKGEGKGFAGLSSLVSDVDTTPPPAAKIEPAAAAPGAGRPAPQPAQPQPSQRQTYQEPAQPSSGGSSGGKWVLGIAAVIGVLWLIGQSNKATTTSSAPAYSPPAQSTAPSYSPPPQPQAPSRPTESKPPVGQDLVFSREQIRYCLAEDIRMEGAKSALNNYIESDVDRFNAMVADYNSRCGSFRYRSGALESARRDIEPYRSQLQSEGRSKFARPSTGSLSTPAPSRPAPDATVQVVQRKLNELGYSAGTPDGLMGRGTRSAIIAFQQDRGLAATGVADQALLLQLQRAPSRSTGGWGANEPVVQDAPPRFATTAPPTSIPQSAFVPAPAPQQQAPSSEASILAGVSGTERAAIENACGYYKRNGGPADYYSCLRREVTSLANSAGRPNLSRANSSEQAAIENACGYHKRNSGPGEYYNCLRRELASLNNSAGPPDLSRASAAEQAAIQNACGYHNRNSGPGEYYNCLRRELSSLANSAGRPDLSRATSSEQAAIENACGYHKRNSGPGEYYNCLRRELTSLANSGGFPDLSRASSSEQTAIEDACSYHRRNSGPGEYYSCLRRELNKMAYR